MKRLKKKTVGRRAPRKKPVEITIRRSSGRKEKFDKERLASTTARSGVPFLLARDIAKNVTKQVRIESKGRIRTTVTGGRIRQIVGEELRNRNPGIAPSYNGDSPQVPWQASHLPKPKVGSADTDHHGVYRGDSDSVMHDKSKRLRSPR